MKMTKMKYLINYTYKGKFKNDEIDFNGFAFEMFTVRYSRRRKVDFIDEYVSYRQPAKRGEDRGSVRNFAEEDFYDSIFTNISAKRRR